MSIKSIFRKITTPFRVVRDVWKGYRTIKGVVKSIKEGSMAGTVRVDVRSAWASKINWTQVVTVLAMILTFFGIDVPEETKTALITAIASIGAVITWVLRTFFTKTVTPGSVPEGTPVQPGSV